MTKVFVYAYEVMRNVHEDSFEIQLEPVWVSLAISEHGKWIAGSVSRKCEMTAIKRCMDMAEKKAVEMISGEVEVHAVDLEDVRLKVAEEKAFTRYGE